MTCFLGNHDYDTSFCKIYVLNFVVSIISRTKFGYKSVWSYFFNPLCVWFIRRYICNSIKKFIWLKLHMSDRFNRHMVGWKKITLKESTWHCRYLSRLRRRWSGWLYFSLTSPLLFSIITEQKGQEKLSANVYLNNFNCYIIMVSHNHITSISYCNILCSHIFHVEWLQSSLSFFFPTFFSFPFLNAYQTWLLA